MGVVDLPILLEIALHLIGSGSRKGLIVSSSQRVVDLRARSSPADILDDWARNVSKLTETLNQARPSLLSHSLSLTQMCWSDNFMILTTLGVRKGT